MNRDLFNESRKQNRIIIPVKVAKKTVVSDKSVVTSVGEAIKAVRIARGMTQQELGLALGFSEKSAGIRISQYESDHRTPKHELLQEIKAVLNCEFNPMIYVEYSLLEPKD